MAGNDHYKLELNLQKLSIIAIATKLWESSLEYKKIRESFSRYQNVNGMQDFVTQRLQTIHLPEKVIIEIQEVIRLIGEKLYYWIRRVIFDFDLESRLAEKISWTCYGSVDEAKTFQLYWQNDQELRSNDFKSSVFSLACVFGQEAFVSKNLSVMKMKLIKYCEPEHKIPKSIKPHALIKIWLCYYLGKDKKDGHRLFKNLESKTNNPDAKILSMCATAGFLSAVKYFVNNLKKGRNKHFFWTAEETIKKLKGLPSKHPQRDNYIEILIFLMANMSVERKILFLKENIHDLFDGFIEVWPYQQLMLQMINFTLPFMIEEGYEKLLRKIITYFPYRDTLRPELVEAGHQMLQNTLEKTPNEIKKRIIFDRREWHLLYQLLSKRNFPTLKIILNDSHIKTCREEIINIGREFWFRSLIKDGNFQILKEFINEFIRDDERMKFLWNFKICLKELLEEQNFEKANELLDWLVHSTEEKLELKREIKSIVNFNVLKKLAEKGNFEMADSLLDWLAESLEEKVRLKRDIDSIEILTAFSRKPYFCLISAAKLLNWIFDGDEESIKAVKIAFRTDEFIRNEFYKIWCGLCISSVEASKTKCSEFLNFFFDSGEIDTYKRDVIIENEKFLKLFCDNLPLLQNFQCVDELLTFCCVGVTEMKRKVLDNIEDWIVEFGFRKKFLMCHAIVNWVFEDEEKKKAVIGNFMNSSGSEELFSTLYRSSSSAHHEELLVFLNLWVPYGNIPKIKECFLASCYYDDRYKIKMLLERLEEAGFVSKRDMVEVLPSRSRNDAYF